MTHGFDEIALVPGDINPNEVTSRLSTLPDGAHKAQHPYFASAMDE